MVCWVSSHVLNFILHNLDIPSEMEEAYQYGIEITIREEQNTLK